MHLVIYGRSVLGWRAESIRVASSRFAYPFVLAPPRPILGLVPWYYPGAEPYVVLPLICGPRVLRIFSPTLSLGDNTLRLVCKGCVYDSLLLPFRSVSSFLL
jgi:hypothetical protein